MHYPPNVMEQIFFTMIIQQKNYEDVRKFKAENFGRNVFT